MTIEHALRYAENRAAVVSYLTQVAAVCDQTLDPNTLNGISDICNDIQRYQQRIRWTLSAELLGRSTARKKPRR